MELALLCFAFYASLAYVCGPLRITSFIIGTALHRFLFLRLPRTSANKPWIGILWFAAFCVVTCAVAGVFPIHYGFFIFGLVPYGYKYWDGTECTGARTWPSVRQWSGWQILRRWIGHYVIMGVPWRKIPENTSLLIACHGHGVFAASAFLTFAVENPEVRSLFTASGGLPPLIGIHWIWFALPVMRELALAMGAVLANASVVRDLLVLQGRHVVLVPEGTRDTVTYDLQPPEKRPDRRNGFIKLVYKTRRAKRHVALLNCEAAGEHELVRIWHPSPQHSIVGWIAQLRLWTLDHTQYAFPTFFLPQPRSPKRRRLVTVIGSLVESSARGHESESYSHFEQRYRRKQEALRYLASTF